jgi:23S rRNA (pseudouridine1915-N3)-methyltransferase
MKTIIIFTGKTTDREIATLVERYAERIKHYIQFDIAVTPDIKHTAKLTEAQICQAEGENIAKLLAPRDHIILLDEHGDEMRSVDFAAWVRKKWCNSAAKRIVFIVGGPYGFSEQIKKLSHESISLSRMTFSHQMARVIIAEQLYRALTILNGEPYHHE